MPSDNVVFWLSVAMATVAAILLVFLLWEYFQDS